MFGSIGVILYLIHSGRWDSVTQVVSVSGASAVNGALLTCDVDKAERERRGIDGVETPPAEARLGVFYSRLVSDRAMPWATMRRIGITICFGVLIGVVIAAFVFTFRGSTVPGLSLTTQAVCLGLVAFPFSLQVGRRLVTRYFRDILVSVTDGNKQTSAMHLDNEGGREHVFCTSGLLTAAPYYFWVGGSGQAQDKLAQGDTSWGFPIGPMDVQNNYTVGDAVMASASLPLIGDVSSPRRTDVGQQHHFEVGFAEPLVDGGGSGLFGQQLSNTYATSETRIANLEAAPAETLVVDMFRHAPPQTNTLKNRAINAMRNYFSGLLFLIGWTRLATESIYVKDLSDAQSETSGLLQLCQVADGVSGEQTKANSDAETAAIESRLDVCREVFGKLGLHNIGKTKAEYGVVAGFVSAFLYYCDQPLEELPDALGSAGELLFGAKDEQAQSFRDRWDDTASRPTATNRGTT